ncbi:MAG TPA: hypothetical protein PKA99_13660 [Dermatophilaceae bacterium]|nr:hypothetical protein [Dermatophilaceae bacterium]
MKPASQTWAGVAVLALALASILTLEITGKSGGVENVMFLVVPVVAALIVNAHTSAKTEEQNTTLRTIAGRLNGELDERIRANVAAALAEPATTGRHRRA